MLKGDIGKMNISFNQLDRSYQKHNEEYNKAVLDVLESGWYVLGKNVEAFEKKFSTFIGSKYCVGLNSGLDALILAFRALGISKGDEVIVPANTYIASVLGITENGATPIFVEPDEFYNIDISKIEEKITHKTKAILVVHLYGQAADLKVLKDLAKKHKLFLVEDCAQSHGAHFSELMTGSVGDIGCFSFYPTKNIGAFGDAGAVVTNNEKVYEKIRMLRNYGSRVKYRNEIVGINSRLDEIQAALLMVKLRHYQEFVNERIRIAQRYLTEINNELITLPKIRKSAEHVWHLFVIKCKDRNDLQNYLLHYGIDTQIHYPIPPHLSEAYLSMGYKGGDFPITEELADSLLSLPLFDGMASEEVSYVIEILNRYEGI